MPNSEEPYFSYVRRPYETVEEHLKLLEQSVTVPSASTLAIGDACRQTGMAVAIGVNERDGGTLYNAQLLFDADGTLIQCRRKINPTHHERMIWGQGDGSGLKAVDSAVGRVGQLACWEHYNPLARYALMADGEQIHAAMYPGSFGGDLFSEQTEVNIRQHASGQGGVAILDAVREFRPPFSPEAVTNEISALLKSYRISQVTGDHYAGEWPRERFRVSGIQYRRFATAEECSSAWNGARRVAGVTQLIIRRLDTTIWRMPRWARCYLLGQSGKCISIPTPWLI